MRLGGHKKRPTDAGRSDASRETTEHDNIATPPKLVSRRENRRSTLVSGRTIGERRERPETASERTAAREKVKKKQARRFISTVIFYIALAAIVIFAGIKIFSPRNEDEITESVSSDTIIVPYAPTIEVIDEAASATGGHLTSAMKEYIGQVEVDLREFGYVPTKAVIPNGAVREVDIYLDGYTGYIKLVTDRGAGVSAEDADRMLRYLASIDVHDFEYIDVRIDGKAYWK
ncbi:hypothetical protein IKF86_01650 [Candidatus Saccharibacteria bacterium]|nr:hypothetical protein [Candidatus Saccharibacteria bacterium]